MDLNLYRRHKRGEGKCKAGLPPDSKSGEFEERKKGWKRCDCLIFASGIFPGEGFKRKSTNEWEWEKAKAVAAKWVEVTPLHPPAAPSPAAPKSRTNDVPISEAIEAYQKEHNDAGSSKGTKTRYDWLSRKVQKYSDENGLVLCGDWTKAHVRLFRSEWGHGPRSTRKTLGQLKTFFAFCIDQDYIEYNPAAIIQRKNVETDRSEGIEEKRTPYTDGELARMYDTCHAYGGRKWTGEDLLDFIAVSVYTGLRISDVAIFHIDKLRPETGEVVLRATKNGAPICTWIPAWLVKRIQYRAQKFGPYIFGSRKTSDPNILGKPWRDRLNELWKLCGEWREKPVHHRFRHTFIRILLQNGKTYELVSELVGDTVQTLRQHYNQWVPSRQEAVTKALTDSFQDVPRPAYMMGSGAEVIAMPKPVKRQRALIRAEADRPAAAQS